MFQKEASIPWYVYSINYSPLISMGVCTDAIYLCNPEDRVNGRCFPIGKLTIHIRHYIQRSEIVNFLLCFFFFFLNKS